MHTALPALALGAAALLALSPPAQETYWVAETGTSTLHEMAPTGEILRSHDVGHRLYSAHAAPDGRVWLIRSFVATFDVLEPDGTVVATPTLPSGRVTGLAFDAAGHAWVVGEDGVSSYDRDGVRLRSWRLPEGYTTDISVDSAGNKWVTHRIGPPGSVSRIDGRTGLVTNHPMPQDSQILPTTARPDSRGFNGASHIWVTGDSSTASEVIELDNSGRVVRRFLPNPTGNLGRLVADFDPSLRRSRFVYVGDYRNGDVWRINIATGSTLRRRTAGTAHDLTFGGFRNLWISDSTHSSIHRHDPVFLNQETDTRLGSPSTDAIATLWQHAAIVAPGQDHDGDGIPSVTELVEGSSPFDPQSTPRVSLSVEGRASLGDPSLLRVVSNHGTTIAFFGLTRATTPYSIPGLVGTCSIAPGSNLPISLTAVGDALFPLAVPDDPSLVGVLLLAQAVNQSASGGVVFSNTTGWLFFRP